MNNYRRILSPGEIAEIIDALERLATIYQALGLPEDAAAYQALIERLKQPKKE